MPGAGVELVGIGSGCEAGNFKCVRDDWFARRASARLTAPLQDSLDASHGTNPLKRRWLFSRSRARRCRVRGRGSGVSYMHAIRKADHLVAWTK